MGALGRAWAALLALTLVARGNAVNKCLAYESTLSDTSLGFCAGVFADGYIYFGNSSVPQAALEGQALQTVTKGSAALGQLLLLLPEECSTQLKRAACAANFPVCQTVNPSFLNPAATEVAAMPVTQLTCDGAGNPALVWDEFAGVCGTPIPVFPCRGECSSISSVASATCPRVSGLFYEALLVNVSAIHPDAAVRAEATALLTAKGCNPGTPGTCGATRFTVNLLSQLGFAPFCENVLVPGSPLGQEVFPDAEQTALKNLVDARISVLTDGTNCGPVGNLASVTCASVQQVYGCATPPSTASTPVQRSYDVLPESGACATIVRDPANQDLALNHLLASRDAAYQPTLSKPGCLQYGKQSRFPGMYFVPPSPGVAPLVSRVDLDGAETDVDTWDETECPNEWDAGAKFGNMRTASAPLCSSAVLGRQGFNARDCLQLTVDEAVARFPKFAPFRCAAAFREYVCGQAQMKPQLRHLCLVPDELGGCETANFTLAGETDRVAFSFSLPRFPAQSTCQKFSDECAALLPTIGLDPNCGGVVNMTTCQNGALSVWGCASGFNGLPLFPNASQTFADAGSIGSLGVYAAGVALNSLTLDVQAPLSTDVAEPTVSAPLYRPSLTGEEAASLLGEFCQCPRPLVVPENPDAETLSPGTCCALPCIGSMFTQDDMLTFGLIQFVLSLSGVLLTLFMLATLLTFEEKRKSWMQKWMFGCSFCISAFFLAMSATPGFNITENLCKDNSTPNTLEDAGFTLNVAQSLALAYFASALCAWWLCQAIDLFRKLVLGTRNTDGSKRVYHLFAWCVPAVEVVALVATRKVGFKPPTPWSFIAGSSELEFAVFYSFIGVCFVTGTAMMASVIFIIVRHTRRSRDLNLTSSSGGNARMWKNLKLYRTPMLFVAAFIVVWADIFSFRFINAFSETAYREDAAAWVGCLLSNFANGIADPATDASADTSLLQDAPAGQSGCGLTQPNGVNFNFLMVTFIIVMSQSHICFLVFGTPARNYTLWLEKFGCAAPDAAVDVSEGSYSKDTGSKGNSYSFQLSSSYQSGAGASPYGGGAAGGPGASPYGNSSRNPGYFAAAAPAGAPPSAPPGLPPSPRGYY